MRVLKAGTRVKTVIGCIEAFVVSVNIEQNDVDYKLRYFSNGEVKECWVRRFEIEISKPKQQAGFGNIIEQEEAEEVTLLQN